METSKLPSRHITHDGKIHHPLGGGSYVFKDIYIDYLIKNIHKGEINISIGAQPNSSPHLGTLVVFNLAHAIGKNISKSKETINSKIFFEIIDTSPANTIEIDGVEYQTSLREEKVADKYLEEYFDLLDLIKSFSGIDYIFRKQRVFNSQSKIPDVLKNIVKNRELIAPILDPQNELLRMRVACPECGLTDKKGINNKYHENSMESYCPEHKWFETSFEKESEKFEYSTPLRNLIRGIVYASDNFDANISSQWLRVTGSDYAGYYQEELLYKTASILGIPAHKLPTIVYAPLITDWSGAKLSKSLYVKQNAYKYLPQYLVNYELFKKSLGAEGFRKLFEEICSWVENPYKLFRNYSVYYFMEILGNGEQNLSQKSEGKAF